MAWLASILARNDDARSIAVNVLLGVSGALVVGLLATGESLVAGISPLTLLAGASGAALTLALYALARMRFAR